MGKKKSKSNILKNFFRGIFILLIVSIGVTASAGTWFYSSLTSLNKGTKSEATKEVDISEPVNILFYGMDNVPGSGASRTDTIMIVHYDPETKHTTMVSLPRDTRIPKDVYKPKVIGKTAKLTEVHYDSQLNSDIDTARDDLINSIEEFFGIDDINYYVSVDYEGFSAIIDVLGGIDIVPIYNMKYYDPVDGLKIDFDKDVEYHLDGEDALKFVRWRKNNQGSSSETDGSDLGRIENQRYFINCLMKQLTSTSGLVKIPALVNETTKYINTDLDADKIIAYAKAILKAGEDNLTSATLEGTTETIDGFDYFVYDASKNREIIGILNNKVIEDRSNLSVNIINSSGINGLAGNLRDKLSNTYGYTLANINTGTGNSIVTESYVIVNSTTSINDTSSLGEEIGISNISQEATEDNIDITIVIGEDFEYDSTETN